MRFQTASVLKNIRDVEQHRVFWALIERMGLDNDFNLVIQAEIAVELDMQVQNVSRAIKELFEQGIIVKGPKNGRYCSYKLNPNMVRLRN
ncbi:MarR family transcriptional regulator [Acidithiobacillus thiooxidans]|uniref:MarR family transcriptional regulator n=1 Tax=Acidithiobacillus thiooxidans TaxID=930 RepID=UPI001C0723A7|nr:helix-turn-helix domain-containing protein [Acidithiobacillus thiooxidans]MBU2811821.1 MarR family transcriptional regulator [Acidithiobacillus thiooxidans]